MNIHFTFKNTTYVLKIRMSLTELVSWLSHSTEISVVTLWMMRVEVILLMSGFDGSEDTDVMTACIPLPPPRHVCELPKQEIWVVEPPMFQRRRLVRNTVQLKAAKSSGHADWSRSRRFKSTVPKQYNSIEEASVSKIVLIILEVTLFHIVTSQDRIWKQIRNGIIISWAQWMDDMERKWVYQQVACNLCSQAHHGCWVLSSR